MKKTLLDRTTNGFSVRCCMIALATVLTGCTLSSADKSVCQEFSDDLKAVLPASAQKLEEKCLSRSPLTPAYKAEFALAPQDLETLQQQGRFAKASSWSSQVPINLDYETEFMRKGEEMQSLLYAEYISIDYLTQILIDTSNPEQYVVYYEDSFMSR